MRRFFTNQVLMVLVAMTMVFAVSCKKKDVKKIEVDNQFAVALFADNITLKEILNDMDSTTNSWLRVRNDSIFAYYADSVNGVLKASDILGDIEDTDFTTTTDFTLHAIYGGQEKDTTMFSEKFTSIPFEYDGFEIEEVILRSGQFTFNIEITPEISMLKQVVIFSEQLVSPINDEPLMITIDYNKKGNTVVDLSGYKIRPDEEKSVSFSSYITFHYDPSIGFEGGTFTCKLVGGVTNTKFKTVYAIVTKALDSVYNDYAAIDFGVKGLSGDATLPVPRIFMTYKNTFGLHAGCNITKMQLVNGGTGFTTDLLASGHVNVDVYPTNGEYRNYTIEGFTDEIDALAGYTRLDFNGAITMALPGEHISLSDTSTVDVIADVEMPISVKINELCYMDTVDIKLGDEIDIQNYLDEIEFTIDYDNQIPINVMMQGLFLRHGHVIDSLFEDGGALLYNQPSQSIKCVVTDRKLDNVMKANKMILRLTLTTKFDDEPVMMVLRESDYIYLRLKMLTKTSSINLDQIL